MNRTDELAVALAAVREASALCRAVQAELKPEAMTKGDRSPVTVADFGSQALVCRALTEAFPEDPIIAEEDAAALRQPGAESACSEVVARVQALRPDATADELLDWIDEGDADSYSPRFWALDPIDGTKGFLRGDQYAVALALVLEGRPALGVLGCPNLDPEDLVAGRLPEPGAGRPKSGGSLLYGLPGEGAFLLPMDDLDAEPRPIRVSPEADPRRTRLCESVESAHTAHDASARVAAALGIAVPPARIDSQAKYAAVAAGAAEAYLRLPTQPGYVEKIWDHAAGAALVEAAGGRVCDVAGRPLDFSQGALLRRNRGVIATNAALHERLLAAVDAAWRT